MRVKDVQKSPCQVRNLSRSLSSRKWNTDLSVLMYVLSVFRIQPKHL